MGSSKQTAPGPTGTTSNFLPQQLPLALRAGGVLANNTIGKTPQQLVPALSRGTQQGLAQLQTFGNTANPGTQAGIAGLMGVADETQVPQLATDQFTKTINGEYMQANPFQNEMVQAAMRPMIEQFRQSTAPSITAKYAASGRSGSPSEYASAFRAEDALGRNLSETAANIGYQNYATERQNQLAMLGQAGDILNLQAAPAMMQLQAGQARDADRLQRAQALLNAGGAVDEFNQRRVDAKASAAERLLAALRGSGGTSTSSQQVERNRLGGALGGAASGAAMGSMFGPWGTVIGAGAGGLMGAFA